MTKTRANRVPSHIPPYSLVRRITRPFEENLVAGDTDLKGKVKVYAFRDGNTWALLDKFDTKELKIVGALQSTPDNLPKLVG